MPSSHQNTRLTSVFWSQSSAQVISSLEREQQHRDPVVAKSVPSELILWYHSIVIASSLASKPHPDPFAFGKTTFLSLPDRRKSRLQRRVTEFDFSGSSKGWVYKAPKTRLSDSPREYPELLRDRSRYFTSSIVPRYARSDDGSIHPRLTKGRERERLRSRVRRARAFWLDLQGPKDFLKVKQEWRDDL